MSDPTYTPGVFSLSQPLMLLSPWDNRKQVSPSAALSMPAVHTGFLGSVGKLHSARSFPWHSSQPKEFQGLTVTQFPWKWGWGIFQSSRMEGDAFATFRDREIKLLPLVLKFIFFGQWSKDLPNAVQHYCQISRATYDSGPWPSGAPSLVGNYHPTQIHTFQSDQWLRYGTHRVQCWGCRRFS